jgi:hypothetical protein
MVDLTTLQTLGYIFGYFSVGIGALSFVINLFTTNRNRKITMATNLQQILISTQMSQLNGELWAMQWSDIEDFKKKYDSSVNPDNYAKRFQMWSTYDLVGYLLKRGLVDLETIYAVNHFVIVGHWVKFRQIIEYFRRESAGKDYLSYWEYAAKLLAKYKEERDPTWWQTTSNFTREEYEKTFR